MLQAVDEEHYASLLPREEQPPDLLPKETSADLRRSVPCARQPDYENVSPTDYANLGKSESLGGYGSLTWVSGLTRHSSCVYTRAVVRYDLDI